MTRLASKPLAICLFFVFCLGTIIGNASFSPPEEDDDADTPAPPEEPSPSGEDVSEAGASTAGRVAVTILRNERVRRALIKGAWAGFKAWWASQQPTLDDLLDRLRDYENIILPDAIDWVNTATTMLNDAIEHRNNMINQLNRIKSELAQLDRDIAAIRLEIAVQVSIRDDVSASPSARTAAARKIPVLEGEITKKQKAITEKNKEMSNHTRYKVIPAEGEVMRLESSLNTGKGNLKRVREAMSGLRSDIRAIRDEYTVKFNQLQADIRAINEALGE